MSEDSLLKAILQKRAGVFEMHELCIKKAIQIVGHVKITKRNIVTHSDRGLLEIMPNGNLREMNDYTYKRAESDNIKMPKSPEGNGEVRDILLNQAWTLTQKEILNASLPQTPDTASSPPKKRGPGL